MPMYTGTNNAEIYIGCGAGAQLSNDILNARTEVSPYISNYSIDDLNILLNRGIKITLVTSACDYEDSLLAKSDEFYKKLIRQVRHTDETARQRREKGIQSR